MSNLFEISEKYENMLNSIESLYEYIENKRDKPEYKETVLKTEEEIERLITALDSIDSDLSIKLNNYRSIIFSKKTENEFIDMEINRLKKRKHRNTKLIDNLKNFIMLNLKKLGKTQYQTSLYTISIRKNPPSVNIIDEHLVPIKYKSIEEIIKIDKKEIAKDLKENKNVTGCELTQSERIDIK
jgi:hypothetical protein